MAVMAGSVFGTLAAVAVCLLSFAAAKTAPPQKACRDVPYQEKKTGYKDVMVDYDCSYTTTKEQCTNKPSTCYKTDYQPQSYDCSETVYETICAPPSKKGHEGHHHGARYLGKKKHYAQYASKTPIPAPQCQKVGKLVNKTCTKSVAVEVAYACSEPSCQMVPQTIQKVCQKYTQQPYEYSTTKYRTECSAALPAAATHHSKKGSYSSW